MTLRETSASGGGGAIAVDGALDVRIDGCTLRSNTATSGDGGALRAVDVRALTIVDSSLRDNSAGANGGAVCVGIDSSSGGYGWSALATDLVDVSDSTFADNEADSQPWGGGALFASNVGELRAEGTAFERNVAARGNGGALYLYRVDALRVSGASAFAANAAPRALAARSRNCTSIGPRCATRPLESSLAGKFGGALHAGASLSLHRRQLEHLRSLLCSLRPARSRSLSLARSFLP